MKGLAADLARGTYLDPDAGRVTVQDFAADWLKAQTFDRSTRDAVALRLRLHVYPILGGQQLRRVKPSTVQAWLAGLDQLAPSYRRVIYVNVSTIFSAAVDDGLIVKNPCRAGSVRRPTVEPRRVMPWEAGQVLAVRDALPERYRIVPTLAAGLGLRQGEVFGLSPADVDFLRGRLEVRRQVKLPATGERSSRCRKDARPGRCRSQTRCATTSRPTWRGIRHGRSPCHGTRATR